MFSILGSEQKLHCFIPDQELSNFYIRVGLTSDTASLGAGECWHQIDALAPGETKQFTCSDVLAGRYVVIHFPTNKQGSLTLCEVEVYTEGG